MGEKCSFLKVKYSQRQVRINMTTFKVNELVVVTGELGEIRFFVIG